MRADRLLSILLLLQVQRSLTARERPSVWRSPSAPSTAIWRRWARRASGAGRARGQWRLASAGGVSHQPDRAKRRRGPDAVPEPVAAVAGRPGAGQGRRRRADQAAGGAAVDRAARRGVRQPAHPYRYRRLASVGRTIYPGFPTIQAAVWQERRLQMVYGRGDGTTVERLVDPLGLVAKGSLWYLIAAVEGDMRTYRVSRAGRDDQRGAVCAARGLQPGGILGAVVGAVQGQPAALPGAAARRPGHPAAHALRRAATRGSSTPSRRKTTAGCGCICASRSSTAPASMC